ncbi:exopolygalacturonase-like [Corylus avellana]|uniref:exopolygalacturonase-like n=1 Tax=Corylus avellana TaxID=13451 RepID=UPI00286C4CFF|nr:exopolygalacturonase-like [Corylus avellana]
MSLELNVATISLLLLLASTANAATGKAATPGKAAPTKTAAHVFDVKSYGAKPNRDITQAVTKAWNDACAYSGSSKVVVPAETYRVGTVNFLGPCKGPIEFNVLGSIHSPGDPKYFKGDSWISFVHIEHLTVSGNGDFDGQGGTAWGRSGCSKNSYCVHLPISLRFDYVINSIVRDITSTNSKQFHINVFGCQNLTFDHVTIKAPQNSPNTDGIHIGRSTNIKVINSKISTGDDCVSLGDGSRNILIEGVMCGPGHGISIGSLGKYHNEEPVIGIRVISCTLTNTQTGVRIKTWPDSYPGAASDMHFENIVMKNVDNPILIDQGYCPWHQCKSQLPSNVKISDVTFTNITGSSRTKAAVQIICSSTQPCQKVKLRDIDLKHKGIDGSTAISRCINVDPIISGFQNPPPCTHNTLEKKP